MQPSGAFPRIAGNGGQSGPGGELVGRADQCRVADGGEEFGAESEADARHAGNHLGEWMSVKSALDVSVSRLDAFIEGDHPLRQFGDQRGGDLFAGQPHGLGLRSGDGGFGDGGCIAYPPASVRFFVMRESPLCRMDFGRW